MSITLSRYPAPEQTEALQAPIAQHIRIGGHLLSADVSVPEGGGDLGPSPHDLYDAALGACKALTVLWYARRRQIPLEQVETVIARDDSDERKGSYRLEAVLRLGGPLTDAQVQELESVAAKCPVHKLMTQVTTEITTRAERLA
ncbi:OsmC family protein [Niveibacterium sp. SC-1]|uniref:OsmC family protein n=1 Tax=Niveibacterium sp. SC-1 TaxID=3135646 RepID=UPI00311D950D